MVQRRKYDEQQYRTTRRRLRREVDLGGAVCWRCGGPIPPGSKFHVGHDDAGVEIMGAEHVSCNLGAQNKVRAARARAYLNGGRVEIAAPAPRAEPVETSFRPWSRCWAPGTPDARCHDCLGAGRWLCDPAANVDERE